MSKETIVKKIMCNCGYAMLPNYDYTKGKYYLECPVCKNRIYAKNQEEEKQFKLYRISMEF